MRKTLNGKSSRCDVSKERNCHRLKAVLDYSFCEVRPGVGPVKKMKSVIAGSDFQGGSPSRDCRMRLDCPPDLPELL